MKKYILLTLSLCLSLGLAAQNTTYMTIGKQSSGQIRMSVTQDSKEKELRSEVAKAQKALMATPDSKEAADKFIAAQKALVTYQKEQTEKFAKAQGAKMIDSKEFQAFKAAEEHLKKAQEEFKKNMDSKQVQQALVNAQKAVFEARKAMQPLIIYNGKPVPSIESVNRDSISSISVLKTDEAVKKYGEKARNGVVILTKGTPAMRKSMDRMRMQYLTRAIGLKDDQKEAFEKTYDSYNKQIEDLRKENNALLEKTGWQNALEPILKNNITIEQKRYEMYKALGKVLTDEQLVKLYKADLKFAKDAMSHGDRYRMTLKADTVRIENSGRQPGKRPSDANAPRPGQGKPDAPRKK